MVDVVLVPVALVQMISVNDEGESTERLVNVALVPTRLVAKKLVLVAFVVVALVAKKFTIVPLVPIRFVAKKFVEVVLVPVALVQTIELAVAFEIMTSPKLPFQRSEGVPIL